MHGIALKSPNDNFETQNEESNNEEDEIIPMAARVFNKALKASEFQ